MAKAKAATKAKTPSKAKTKVKAPRPPQSGYFLGEIGLFGFNFAPVNFARCDGSYISIEQNQALFALLGTTYGGNGVTIFALPKLAPLTPAGGPSYFICTNGAFPSRN